MQQPYHYIAIDVYGWACSEQYQTAINNRDNDTGEPVKPMNVYFIPLPDEGSEYEISAYVPQVKGALLAATRTLDGTWERFNQDVIDDAILELQKNCK